MSTISDIKEKGYGNKALWLTVGNLTNSLITVFSIMVVTRALSQIEYATYRQTFLAFNFALPFLSLGISEGLYYFLPTEKSRFSGRVFDAYVVCILAGIVFSMFIILGGNNLLALRFNNPKVAPLLYWLIPYALIVLISNTSSVIFNIQNKMKLYVKVNIISTIAITFAFIIAIIASPTAKTAVIVMSIGHITRGLIFIVATIKILPDGNKRPQLNSIKELVLFSLPLGVATMIGQITSQMDSLFVSVMTTPKEFAIYSVGAIEVPVIGIILGSFSTAIIPDMRKLIQNNDIKSASDLFISVTKKIASITLPIMTFLFFWSNEFVLLLYSNKYYEAVPIFQVYLLYFFIRIAFTGPIFVSFGMNSFLLKKTIISLFLNAILTFVFIKFIGPIGAAIGTILSSILITVVVVFPILGKKFIIKPWLLYPVRYVIEITMISLIVALIVKIFSLFILHGMSSALDLFISVSIFALVYLLINYTFFKEKYNWLFNYCRKIWSDKSCFK